MTHIVSGGALNSTHSLTHSGTCGQCSVVGRQKQIAQRLLTSHPNTSVLTVFSDCMFFFTNKNHAVKWRCAVENVAITWHHHHHSKVNDHSFWHASPRLWNQLPIHHSEFLIRIIRPLSATFIWICRSNLLHTAITFHQIFTFSLWVQNLPFQKILSSTLVCFCLSDWSHGSRPFTGLTCSLVFMF